MLAARLHAPGERLRVEEIALPEPTGTQVRIRVAGCGVCRTDLHLADGTQRRVVLPRVLGHEVAGWIDAVGPEAAPAMRELGLDEGDAVVVFGGWGCGTCHECDVGAEQRCPNSAAPGFQLDGGYADAMLVPHPRHLEPLHELDPVTAGPLADAGVTAHRAVARAERWLGAGSRVLIIGAGGVGGLLLQLLRRSRHGADLLIVAADPNPARRAQAGKLGADVIVPAAVPDVVHSGLGRSADAVFDLVGTDETLLQATGAAAPDGVVVLVGEAGGRVDFGFDATALEAWLTTVAWGSRADLAAVVGMARAGELRWRTERVPLREAQAAHDRLRAGGVDGRLVLVPGFEAQPTRPATGSS